MAQIHFYEVNVDWEKDREGILSSPVLEAQIYCATPPEFPKGVPGIWSPEHLLVAAVNSCLMTTFLSIAENSLLPFVHFKSSAIGKLEIVDGRYMISEITLSPVLEIADAAVADKALRILQKSEAACLISNSVKSRIIFEPKLITSGQKEQAVKI